jgi:hypothetical protein
MKRARLALLIARHTARLCRAGQLRFRLETFGAYYPSPPYSRPWWRVSARTVALLLRRLPAYAAWVVEMEELRAGGAAAWWERRRRQHLSDDN